MSHLKIHSTRSIFVLFTIALATTATFSFADDPTPIFPDGRLGFGSEGLGIPETIIKDSTSPRTVELLGKALDEPHTTPQLVQLVKDLGECKKTSGSVFIRKMLRSPEPTIRAEAVRSAAKLNDASLAADLKPLLGDKEQIVRREVIIAGAALGDPSFVTAGLAEKDPLLLGTAIASAATSGHADALASILPSLSPSLQLVTIRALGRLKAISHEAEVVSHFTGDIPHRAAAVHAIGLMKATGELTAVERLLADPHPTVRREAVGALAGVAEPKIQQRHAIERLSDEDRSVREASARLLVNVPTKDAVDLLVQQLDDDYHPLYLAARDAIVAAGADAVPAAVKLLDNRNPRRREDGSYVLGELKSDAGFERHVALMSDPDWPLVEQVSHSLGRIGRKDAAPTLAKLATRAATLMKEDAVKKDPIHANSACREAIVACGLLGYKDVLPPIIPIIPQREQYAADVRAAAVWVFGMIGDANDASVQGMLGGLLGDIKESEMCKFEAIKAWGNQKRKAALGSVQSWDSGGGFASGPRMRWIMHWAFDRITGTQTPYTPPVSTKAADVSISDLTEHP
jgi:HEAT repeat protein